MTQQALAFDDQKLATYLEHHVPDFKGPVTSEKFSGGQSNPTFLITATSGKYVLRRKPPGQLLKSAHAVDREFCVIQALQETDVPVARAIHLCEDDDVIGSMFYLMSFEDGTVYWDPSLPDTDQSQRMAIHQELVRVMAAMHEVDFAAVGLGDYGRPGNYYERQIDRWTKQYRAAETDKIEEMEALMTWLPEHLPPDDGQVSLIHGDFRLDNLMYYKGEARIRAVLDWELSTLGHPIADLAYHCMSLRMPSVGMVRGLAGLNCAELGLPTEEQIIEQYCNLRGLSGIDNWNFYLVLSYFRLASICQGVYKRALSGNASNKRGMDAGKFVQPLAMMASQLL